MNASVLSFLSAVSEKLTSDLFKGQGGVSITEFALIFLTLMPAAVSTGAIRIPNVGIAFGFFLKRLKKFGRTRIVFLQKNRCLPPFCCQKYQNVPK